MPSRASVTFLTLFLLLSIDASQTNNAAPGNPAASVFLERITTSDTKKAAKGRANLLVLARVIRRFDRHGRPSLPAPISEFPWLNFLINDTKN